MGARGVLGGRRLGAEGKPAVDVLFDEGGVNGLVLDEGAKEDGGGEVRSELGCIDSGREFAAFDAALNGGDGELLATLEEAGVEFGDSGIAVGFDDERHGDLAELRRGEQVRNFTDEDDEV